MAGFQTKLQAKTQALVLHYLKAHGGAIETASRAPSDSLIKKMAEDFREKQTVVKYALRQLEKESLVLISHLRPIASFGEGKGYNPITRIEMVDPEMELPELKMPEYFRPDEIPAQQSFVDEDAMGLTPLGRGQKHSVTYQMENEEMQTRYQTEPTTESIILALLNRNDELQAELFARAETIAELREQVEKLQEVISKQAAEQMNKPKPPPRDAHLTQRIRGALTPEQWDALMASRPIN